MRFNTFTEAYLNILNEILANGQISEPRGLKIRELLNFPWMLAEPQNCKIDFSKTGYPERQKVYDSYCENELTWYKSGNLNADSAPSKFWLKLADTEGKITSNYGWMTLHDRKYPGNKTGFEFAVSALQSDLDSRQAVLHYSEPRHQWSGNKDVPCTVAAQVLVRQNLLHMSVYQRSCDVIKGLSFDVPWHCWLMAELAQALSVKLGTFTHFVGSIHLYERDLELAQKIVNTKLAQTVAQLDAHDFHQFRSNNCLRSLNKA